MPEKSGFSPASRQKPMRSDTQSLRVVVTVGASIVVTSVVLEFSEAATSRGVVSSEPESQMHWIYPISAMLVVKVYEPLSEPEEVFT
jgi:hypothetical protein